MKEVKPKINPAKHTTDCPLCGCAIEYKDMLGTHIWKCPDCPFIGLEFYTMRNISDLETNLVNNFTDKNLICQNERCENDSDDQQIVLPVEVIDMNGGTHLENWCVDCRSNYEHLIIT